MHIRDVRGKAGVSGVEYLRLYILFISLPQRRKRLGWLTRRQRKTVALDARHFGCNAFVDAGWNGIRGFVGHVG